MTTIRGPVSILLRDDVDTDQIMPKQFLKRVERTGYGFRAVIAAGFSDIFRSNATKIGLLPVQLSDDEVRAVAQAGEAEIDLDAQEVRAGGRTFGFEIDPDIKHRLLGGLDDIGLTLQQAQAIDAYESAREGAVPAPPVTTALG